MAQVAWRRPPLTQEEEDDLFMLMLADDEEDSPWMVMGDLQFWSATAFAHSLRNYAHERELPWYVASMLLIEYTWPHVANKKKLAPDVFVAFVPERARTSYDVAEEGAPPPFVLEVVSPSSSTRDRLDKRRAYDLLGAREYAMFTPREGKPSILAGYRRGAHERFVPWRLDAQGRLWSEVLGLYLVVRGTLLQAQTPEGRILLTPREAELGRLREAMERRRAEEERQQAEERRQHAEDARRNAEDARQRAEDALEAAERENERLRQEIARYRAQAEGGEHT